MIKLHRYLIAGLLVWLPLIVTLLLVRLLVGLMDSSLLLLPMAWQPEALLGFRIPGLGILLTLVVLVLTGMVVANLVGKQMVVLWERLLRRIPLVRSVYSGVKQLAETLFGSGKSFRKVVLVEFPHPGSWTLGFLTGEGATEVNQKTGQDVVNVFVPTTPMPTNGFFLMIPRASLKELDMSVEEGLKLLLSAGVVLPQVSPVPSVSSVEKKRA